MALYPWLIPLFSLAQLDFGDYHLEPGGPRLVRPVMFSPIPESVYLPYPQSVFISNLQSPEVHDFVAIKVGDVNGSSFLSGIECGNVNLPYSITGRVSRDEHGQSPIQCRRATACGRESRGQQLLGHFLWHYQLIRRLYHQCLALHLRSAAHSPQCWAVFAMKQYQMWW